MPGEGEETGRADTFPGEKQGTETGSPLWILASAGLNWPGAFCMAEDQMLNGLSP